MAMSKKEFPQLFLFPECVGKGSVYECGGLGFADGGSCGPRRSPYCVNALPFGRFVESVLGR